MLELPEKERIGNKVTAALLKPVATSERDATALSSLVKVFIEGARHARSETESLWSRQKTRTHTLYYMYCLHCNTTESHNSTKPSKLKPHTKQSIEPLCRFHTYVYTQKKQKTNYILKGVFHKAELARLLLSSIIMHD